MARQWVGAQQGDETTRAFPERKTVARRTLRGAGGLRDSALGVDLPCAGGSGPLGGGRRRQNCQPRSKFPPGAHTGRAVAPRGLDGRQAQRVRDEKDLPRFEGAGAELESKLSRQKRYQLGLQERE